jgi:osmotically-inducible protein OsmY
MLRLHVHFDGGLHMISKIATALILAGLAVAPAATYAEGTSKQAGATMTTTQATQNKADMATPKTDVRAADKKNPVADAAITTKVKSKFAADSQVSALNIHVDTDNGVVKLSGTAKSQQEAAKAAEIAKATEGVSAVENSIHVGAAGTKY